MLLCVRLFVPARREAFAGGIYPRDIYSRRDAKTMQISRGVYPLAEIQESENGDTAAVTARAADGVICLITALSNHEITSGIEKSPYYSRETRLKQIDNLCFFG